MQSKWLTMLYIFEETVILAAVLHLCVFTGWGFVTETARIGWGWSLIIVISLHFFIVCLYIVIVFMDYLRMLFIKYQAIWRVFCVRAFGFRVGKKYKEMFGVKVGEGRHVQQMMELEENKDKDNIGLNLQDN